MNIRAWNWDSMSSVMTTAAEATVGDVVQERRYSRPDTPQGSQSIVHLLQSCSNTLGPMIGRLGRHVKKIFPNHQVRFRRGRVCRDVIFIMPLVIKMCARAEKLRRSTGLREKGEQGHQLRG